MDTWSAQTTGKTADGPSPQVDKSALSVLALVDKSALSGGHN